ncbi:MAG: amidohydrolase family protein [Candidatus Sericytochromatia bacterium]|nr:amidohydrolase family protein [Candidatus Sericytochromatia bacterium]
MRFTMNIANPHHLITAGLICPVDQDPIPGGFLTIDAAGRIAAVGRQADLPGDRWGLTAEDHPDGILVPGLINLHTHLEYTHVPTSGGPLHAWILRLIGATRDWTLAQRLASAEAGVLASLAAGVTCVADTTPTGASLIAANRLGLRGVFYQESFGLDDGAAAVQRVSERLDRLAEHTGDRQRLGISPHAPYTVSVAHWARLNALAEARDLRLSTHLAESPAELAWFAGESSPIPDYHAALGLPPYVPPHGHPIRILHAAGLLRPGMLAAHCVHTGPAERVLLRDAGVIAVHCPRSNAGLGCGTGDVTQWEHAGLSWGIGTDSAASSGSLDLRGECTQPTMARLSWPAARLLRQVTLEAARHLGWEDAIGSLTPGKWADLTVLVPPAGAAGQTLAVSDWIRATVRQTRVAGSVLGDGTSGHKP